MKNRKSNGFTIIEFLLYIGILSILLLVFADLFISMARLRTKTESTSNVQQDSSYLINKFIYDIHQASTVSIPAQPSDQSPILNLVINGVNNSYSLQGGNLVLSDGNRLNGYDTTISNLQFTRLGQGDIHDVIKINFTINSLVKNQAGYETQSYETVAGLREKP
ncbi:MAG: prepilin-type N-terminal cleavage/methylation domain-containing protein [Patescibacteria group bacterium]